SAAIKNVPEDTIEAARIDGATEIQIFWRVVVPQIRSSIVVVGTTILILVLKVFDIILVTTGGDFGTDVVANRFITELFINRHAGRATVLVVFLIAVTIPFMIVNIRRFRAQEAER
ncbi:MAG TPA: ABC transporter permease subunit, partial [Nitriliruptorales bacterium]